MVRWILLGLLGVAACSSPPAAPPTVIAGEAVLAFDHNGVDTERYELCWGSSTCIPIAVAPIDDSDERRFTLPAAVPLGVRELSVVAIGPAGQTAGDTSLTVRVED